MAPKPSKPQKACNVWNAQHAIGTRVVVRTDSKGNVNSTTTSVAYVAGGHTAVIHLADISGFYALERVTAAPIVGYADGEACNRDGCTGTMEILPVENCSCHLSAPCNRCVENDAVCNTCTSNN